MKKEIDLYIKNELYYSQDNSDLIDYSTSAMIYKKNNLYYILYSDKNYNGARTCIKIWPLKKRVSIHRYKPELKELFQPGTNTVGSLSTAYGRFNLEIYTLLLKIDINNGRIEIRYKLYLNENYVSKNYLRIFWDIL